MAVQYHTHEFQIPTATKEETETAAISDKVVVPSGLSDFLNATAIGTTVASAAQGAKADTALQPGDVAINVPIYDTLVGIPFISVPGSFNAFRTNGYSNPGDGGAALYKRVDTEPDHEGKVQSADGAWWELAEAVVTPQMFGARANFDWSSVTGTDDTAAIRAAISLGRKVHVPKGLYRVTDEIELVTVGQVIEFENTGGYGYGEDIGANWQNNTAFVATGTFAKRIRTRRLFRGSVSDPQDDALSVVLNVQAENVHLIRPCVRLYCDYSDTSPTNLGDDCDVGIFIGCRVGVQIHDPIVTDYFRNAGIYIDVTHATNLPRFPDLDGAPYPNSQNISGGDGTHIYNPYTRGPRKGVFVAGALPKAGETTYTDPYYDEILGEAVSDFRGTFGFSDFDVFGGRIYGPDHHSNRRLADPTLSGGSLNQTSLLAEPDTMPAAMHIDGLAGNGNGAIHGMNFFGTRFATFEAFRVRLGYQARARFWGCHIEGRNGGRMDTAGNVIDTNDYTLNSYGPVSGIPVTKRLQMYGTTFTSVPHYYGEDISIRTDTGDDHLGMLGVSDYVGSDTGELDLRGVTGSGIRFRSGNVSIGTISATGTMTMTGGLAYTGSVIATTGEADIRSATGSLVRFRVGSTTVGTMDATRLQVSSGNIRVGGSAGSPDIRSGTGDPEGVIAAAVGSLWVRTDGGAATALYVKESGTGNTGWIAK